MIKRLMGNSLNTMDSKGRLVIPANMREILGESFVVTISPKPCLTIYPLDKWEAMAEAMEELTFSESESLSLLFAFGTPLEPDAQGRVLLSSALIKQAGLKKRVMIVGNNTTAEIWDEDTWNEYMCGPINDKAGLAASLDALVEVQRRKNG